MKIYRIGNIEVMDHDLPSKTQNEVSYFTAWEAMASAEYMDFWRIPTPNEMRYLISLSMEYRVLNIHYKRPYWTSHYEYDGSTAKTIFGDSINLTSMYNLYPVRFVRDAR
jgi:hypothetical protein